ncbi:unnamed protein product [Urochloa humidicola]
MSTHLLHACHLGGGRGARAAVADTACHRLEEPSSRRLLPGHVADHRRRQDGARRGASRVADHLLAAEAAHRGVAPPRRTSLVATLGLVCSWCYQRAKAAIPSPSSTPTESAGGGDGDDRTCLLADEPSAPRHVPRQLPRPGARLGTQGCARRRRRGRPGRRLRGGRGSHRRGGERLRRDGQHGHVGESIQGGRGRDGPTVSVAGSRRFRVYELDMGFGRPAKVDVVSVARTCALALVESRHGGGGMELGIPLPPDDMKRFRECFADAIAGLHAPS